MNLINIKKWKRNSGCTVLIIVTIVTMFLNGYWFYMFVDSDFENQRFNSGNNKSLETLNLINTNRINDLKISNSLYVFTSINYLNLDKIKPNEFLCTQLDKMEANTILSIINPKLNLSEIEKNKFSLKYEKLKQLCTN